MLRDDQFDPATGELLPSLAEPDEDNLYPAEVIEQYGQRLRDEYITRQAAKAKMAYAPQATEPLPKSKLPGEPKRINGKPRPVWNERRNCWTPTHLYYYPLKKYEDMK
jgi:hypothetical protein